MSNLNPPQGPNYGGPLPPPQGPPGGPHQPPQGWQAPPQPPTKQEARAQAVAAKAHRKAMRPWFKKKRFIVPLALVALMFVVGVSGGKDDVPTAGVPATSQAVDQKSASSVPTKEPSKDTAAKAPSKDSAEPSDDSIQPTEEPEPKYSAEQENAIEAAQNYLSFTPFSKKGLIRQLSSDAGDGYSKNDATIAVESLDVDYREQAGKAAQNYLDLAPFSKQGLIRQLSSDAGDGYSKSEATDAVGSLDVDYKQQAVKAAENYLKLTSFSKQGLIEQLSSSAGDGYTAAQATYGAEQALK